MLANLPSKHPRLLSLIGTVLLFTGQACAQSPFGPPPIDDGFVPIDPNHGNAQSYYPPTDPWNLPPSEALGTTNPEYNFGSTSTSQLPSLQSDPKPTYSAADSSLVGPRYASQGAMQAPPSDVYARPSPPSEPSRPIDYPIARQPGEQILAEAETNEECKVFARVGGQIILGCEFLDRVNMIMEANKDRIPPQNWETQRLVLIKEVLDKMIENKLVIADARRKIPAEALPNVERQVNDEFVNNQLPRMMADAKVKTRIELEEALKESGSSLEEQRKLFLERAIGAQWLRQSINTDREVTHAEMWKYYQEHLEDYRNEAKAMWQELHVSVPDARSRDAAFQKIAQMGNDVALRGVPFEVVARTHSNGLTAKQGGVNEWTSKGSLKSEKLDQALFAMPLNQLSPIIEESDGFYIIRVLERQDESYTPFREAQVEIAETIKNNFRQEEIESYYVKLRTEIPVWTIFDDPRVAEKLPPTHR